VYDKRGQNSLVKDEGKKIIISYGKVDQYALKKNNNQCLTGDILSHHLALLTLYQGSMKCEGRKRVEKLEDLKNT